MTDKEWQEKCNLYIKIHDAVVIDNEKLYIENVRLKEAVAAEREKVVAEMTDAANEACQRAMEFEREECAKVCDGIVAQYGEDVLVAWFAEDIRARGQE